MMDKATFNEGIKLITIALALINDQNKDSVARAIIAALVEMRDGVYDQ